MLGLQKRTEAVKKPGIRLEFVSATKLSHKAVRTTFVKKPIAWEAPKGKGNRKGKGTSKGGKGKGAGGFKLTGETAVSFRVYVDEKGAGAMDVSMA
eukprot:Skav226599  [mRNA]  locus=scaffold5607:51141:58246:+ [translate_table: standard]